MTIQELTALAGKIGFEHTGSLDPATIELKEEVREMCASGKCAMYDKRWSCPPGCGTLDDCRELLKVIRAIHAKRIAVAEKGRRLGQVDERSYKQAEDKLHGELAVSLGIPVNDVRQFIIEALER